MPYLSYPVVRSGRISRSLAAVEQAPARAQSIGGAGRQLTSYFSFANIIWPALVAENILVLSMPGENDFVLRMIAPYIPVPCRKEVRP